MKRLFIAIIALSVLAACGNGSVKTYNGPDAGEIYIGAAYPIAANDSTTYLRQGIELAVEEINESGGVLGKPLRVFWRDDENDANAALRIAQRFSDLGITAVVGHWSSAICYVVEDIYEKNKVIMMMPSAVSGSIFETNYDYIFRTCGNSLEYASVIAQSIADKGYDNIAISYSDDVFGFDFANNVEAELSKRGITVIDRVTNLSVVNAEKISQRWNAFGCQGVVMSNVMPEAASVIRAVRSMNKAYPIWGADNFQRSNLVSSLDGDASMLYRIENDFSSTESDFLSAFAKRHGHNPDIFAVAGYNAVRMLGAAMNDCGSTDATVLAEYLSNIRDFRSASGTLSYDKDAREFSGHKFRVTPVAE